MIPKLNKAEVVADYHAVDPQLSRLFYDSDFECAQSVASAGPPPPDEEIILCAASPQEHQEIEGELMFREVWGDDSSALTPLQSKLQAIGKAARQQDVRAGRVSDDLLAKASEKLYRLIRINSNGDLLEKRVHVDVDVEEFMHDSEDPNTPSGKKLDELIEKDDPTAHQYLRALTLNNMNGARAVARKILDKFAGR